MTTKVVIVGLRRLQVLNQEAIPVPDFTNKSAAGKMRRRLCSSSIASLSSSCSLWLPAPLPSLSQLATPGYDTKNRNTADPCRWRGPYWRHSEQPAFALGQTREKSRIVPRRAARPGDVAVE